MIIHSQSFSYVLLNAVYQIGICLTVIFEVAHSGPVPCCSMKSHFLNSSTVNWKVDFASRIIFFEFIFYLRNHFHCSTKLISKPYYLSDVQQNYSLYLLREVPNTIDLKILRKERSIMDTSHSFKNVHFECHKQSQVPYICPEMPKHLWWSIWQ